MKRITSLVTLFLLLMTPFAAVHAQAYSVERGSLYLDGQASFTSTGHDFEGSFYRDRAPELLLNPSVQYLITPGLEVDLTRSYLLEAEFASESESVVVPVLGGVLGGAAGLFGGGFIGYTLDTSVSGCEGEMFCGLGGALLGAWIGETIGLPLGVHLGNKRRGNFGLSLLANAGVTTLGVLLVGATEVEEMLLPISVVQLAVSVSIERATRRK